MALEFISAPKLDRSGTNSTRAWGSGLPSRRTTPDTSVTGGGPFAQPDTARTIAATSPAGRHAFRPVMGHPLGSWQGDGFAAGPGRKGLQKRQITVAGQGQKADRAVA